MSFEENLIVPKIETATNVSKMAESLPNLIDENSGAANLWTSFKNYMTVEGCLGCIIGLAAVSAGFAMYYFKTEIGNGFQSGYEYVTGLFHNNQNEWNDFDC